MKATRTVFTEGIPQALAKGHCPVCSLLAGFQSQFIEGAKVADVSHFCNYHAWAAAKAAPADLAIRVFHRMVEQSGQASVPSGELSCDLCDKIRDQDRARTEEMIQQLKNPSVRQWMKLQGSFCIAHAKKIGDALPAELRDLVGEIMSRNRGELLEELTDLLGHLKQGDRTGWGSLGRAAEFLVSQRGISR
jgi:hypothetical protein